MKVHLLLFVLAATSLFASGCKSKPTLIGEWSGTLPIQGTSVQLDFQFRPDGTLSVRQTVNGQGSTQKGTYKAEDKTFSMMSKSIESPTVPKDTLDKMNAQLAKNPKSVTFNLDWKDADTIEITQQGAPPPLNAAITLKRRK